MAKLSKSTRRLHAGRRRLFIQQGKRCYYCGVRMKLDGLNTGNSATLDHIIARSKGGPAAPSQNCVAACAKCNNERGDRDARIFLLEKMGLA